MKRYFFRKKRIWAGLICSVIAAVVVLFGINSYVQISVSDKIFDPEEIAQMDADCILVLGAGVWGERPSHMLEDGLIQSIELYKKGASDKLLMSGDHGRKEYDEVNVMKQFAVNAGVPSENIFMDHAGFSTYESLYRVRDVFKAEKIIIVTQKYHLYRALYVAERLGLDAYGVSADLRIYAGQDYREIREIIARIKDFFYVIVKPKPTYLGKPIPVSGNGNFTND